MAKRIRQLLGLLAASLVLLGVTVVARPVSAIVGGESAVQSFPWAAALLLPGSYICGGSLISPTWVLTAAHCVYGIRQASDLTVRTGSIERGRGGSTSTARQLVVDPYYVGTGQIRNDLALVQLGTPAPQPPIPLADEAPSAGAQLRLLGWGQTCPIRRCDGGSSQLKELDVKVTDDSMCAAMDPQTELCLLGPQGQGPCFGDSGGPAIARTAGVWALEGATSRGPSPCTNGDGAIYTSVAAYRSWIDEITGV